MNFKTGLGSAVAIIIFLIVIGPLCTIWSLNTLFPALDIPYDFDHWIAVVILGGVFKSNIIGKDRS
jgi:hypothetical protein